MSTPVHCSRQLFSPCLHISEADERQLQQSLCHCFEQWGLPKHIKVDNGKPLGDPQRSSVPALALWLIALGIQVIWNRPRSPKDNPKVERMQATSSRWAEIEQCNSCTELQSRLDKAARVQTEQYPLRRMGNKNRKELYPALYNNSRTWSSNAFDLGRVQQYLSSKVTFVRKVSKGGTINFYAQSVYLGIRYKNSYAYLHYDAPLNHFRVEDESRTLIGWFTADNFNMENVLNLAVCQYRSLKCSNFVSQPVAQT
jgi:hypothetical protein